MTAASTLVMPKLGLTMTEGLLAEWKVAPGASFHAGEVLCVVETDKIANEIEAEADGSIAEILVPEGQVVAVGTPLARLGNGGAVSMSEAPAPQLPATPPANGRVIATPLAKRLAREHGLPLQGIAGSGPRGRIKAADVEQAAKQAPLPAPDQTATGERHRPSPAQATVARRLEQAKREIPHFYLTRSAELSLLLALKAEVDGLGTWGRTTLTPWLVAAVGRALEQEPSANRVWDAGEIVALSTSDVGVAIDAERGLYAPVIPAAGRRNPGEIAEMLARLVEAAAAGRLGAAEMTGGAIAVSNLGMHGVESVTPIINPGQAMILGIGRTSEVFRPDGEGRPQLRRETLLTLAADHRVINGVAAARFLGRIVVHLENPLGLLVPPLADPEKKP